MDAILEIRPATVDDVPDLIALIEHYWRFEKIDGFDRIRVAAQLRRLLSQAHLGCGWIALDQDGLIGYLLAVYVFSLEHLGLTAEIDEFFVVPEYRAQGVGTRLLQSAEAAFVAVGCTNVALQLARDNDATRAFYRRQGYAERAGYEILDKMLQPYTKPPA